jgi:hypothetical protein
LNSGTFNLWIEEGSYRDAFANGTRYRWGSFTILGESCCLVSEGATLAGIVHGNTSEPIRIFDIPFALDWTRRRHLITIGWKSERLRVYLDSRLLADLPLSISKRTQSS